MVKPDLTLAEINNGYLAYKKGQKDILKELILEFESNQLEGKGYDFYFAIRTKLDELLKDNKE